MCVGVLGEGTEVPLVGANLVPVPGHRLDPVPKQGSVLAVVYRSARN